MKTNTLESQAIDWIQGMRQAIAEKNSSRIVSSKKQAIKSKQVKAAELKIGDRVVYKGQTYLIKEIVMDRGFLDVTTEEGKSFKLAPGLKIRRKLEEKDKKPEI